MAEPEFMQMGKSFVGFYYPAFAENRGAGSQLANVYTDQVSPSGIHGPKSWTEQLFLYLLIILELYDI